MNQTQFSFYKSAQTKRGNTITVDKLLPLFSDRLMQETTSIYRTEYLQPSQRATAAFEAYIPNVPKWAELLAAKKELAKVQFELTKKVAAELITRIEKFESAIGELLTNADVAEAARLEAEHLKLKDRANDFKTSHFPAVTWYGTFSPTRSIANLKTQSGFMVMDVDKLTRQQHDTLKKLLANDPYIFVLFTSPSGLGLKLIFKINIDDTPALTYFLALKKYLKAEYNIAIDDSGKDVCRLCFLCFDNRFYHNAGCLAFPLSAWSVPVQQEPEKPLSKAEEKELSSVETLDDILRFTERKATYTEGSRNKFLNLFGWNCNLRGIPKQECIDYAQTFAFEAKDGYVKGVIDSVYNSQSINFGKYAKRTKTVGGYQQPNSPASGKSGKPEREAPDHGIAVGQPEGDNSDQRPGKSAAGANNAVGTQQTKFWSERSVTRGKDTNKYQVVEYALKRVEFVDWLLQQGFHLIDTDTQGGYQICYSNNGIIDPTDPRKIKKYVFTWCRQNVVRDIEEMMREKQRSIFAMEEMNSLHTKAISFKTDTDTESYFYFAKSWITVTAKAITTHSYTELRQFIWQGNKKDHELQLQPVPQLFNEAGKLSPAHMDCEFARFIYFASYNPNNPEEKDFTDAVIMQRFEAFCSAIGFMLDSYKHPADRKAVFALDHKVSEKGEKHGRTGKSIIPKACEKLKVVSHINGKTFDPRYSFRYEVITADSQIINFNDMKATFDPEEIFEVIADDYSILRRNNGYLHFKYENSPKVWYSTNATPKGDGTSYAGRMFVLEFSDYFTPDHTPFDEFGHGLLGAAWDVAEWNRFYNFMLFCVQIYKLQGFVPYPNSNLNERRLKNEVDVEFIDYMNEWPRNLRSDKKPHLESVRKLLSEAHGGGKPLSANSFHRWVKRYCSSNGLYFNPHIPPGKYDKVGGTEYYTIATTPDYHPGDQENKMFTEKTEL